MTAHRRHAHRWHYLHAVWEGHWIARFCTACDVVQAAQARRWREPPATHTDIAQAVAVERELLRRKLPF